MGREAIPPAELPSKGGIVAQVQVKCITVIMAADANGTLKTYYPGDWVALSKQKAIEYIETGQVEIPDNAQAQAALTEDLSDCGIYLRNGTIRDAKEALGGLKVEVLESSGPIRLPFDRTLIWDVRQPLGRKQIALGFTRVDSVGAYASWEVAAMLRSNELLALQIGDKAEQRRTLEAVGDLRLPVYETGAVWIRKTKDTQALVKAWNAELRDSTCEEHAFLRALYASRVLLCSLPAGWLGRWRR